MSAPSTTVAPVGPAPIDPAAVRACLAGSGTMLPGPAYTDEAVLAWERRVFFAGGWVCAGRTGDLARRRARRAVRIGDDTILLVRGEDGVLRGFHNTCRHRGHELLAPGPATSAPFITCPYHSWVYDLTGALHKVPSAYELNIDQTQLPLVSVAVAEWQGFVLVNADGSAPALARYLNGMTELLDGYGCADLVVAAGHSYDLAANWKLVGENYHECYHCSTIHPELCRVSPPDSGNNYEPTGLWMGGKMSLSPGVATMSLDGRAGVPALPGLTPAQRREVLYLHLFPSLLVSLAPDYVMTHQLWPLDAGRTRVVCQWLFHPDAVAASDFDPAYAVDFWDLTNRQDWAACEGVQRGVRSRGYRPGPLSPWHEGVVFQSVSVVARAYLDGRLPERATAGGS
jgi:glycine betaine catabolism A